MKSVNNIGNISIEVAAIGLQLNISDIETTIEANSPEEYAVIMDKKHEQTKEILAEVKTMIDKVVDAIESVEKEEEEIKIPDFLKQGKHPLEGILGGIGGGQKPFNPLEAILGGIEFDGEEDEQPTNPFEALLDKLSKEAPPKLNISKGGLNPLGMGIPPEIAEALLNGAQIKKFSSLGDLLKHVAEEEGKGKDGGPQGFPFSL